MQVQPGEFTGALQCFRKTIFGEGLTALWRGSLPAFLGAVSENAVAFGVNGELKRYFASSTENSFFSSMKPFLMGSITGFCTAFVLCPSDVIKCRAQLSRANGGSGRFREIVLKTMQTDGIGGFYTGISAQILRDIPFYGFFFGTYDVSCRYLKKNTSLSDSTVYFMSGGFAGQVAWAASMPVDVIKSIIQTQTKKTSLIQTVLEVFRSRGIRGLYYGIEVAIIRAFPANAALFVGYEISRSLIS